MRFAYADPPYLGASRRYYREHPEHAVYDTVEGHHELIAMLVADYPDGWALSMASKNLHPLLPACPPDARVMAWCKPYTTFFPGANPGWCWEPVVVYGGRRRGKDVVTVRDYVIANSPAQRGRGFVGRKPDTFAYWLFEVLGARPDEDELVDIFPGSGAIGHAWARWCNEPRLALARPGQHPALDEALT